MPSPARPEISVPAVGARGGVFRPRTGEENGASDARGPHHPD